jgi:hypothetical protein
MTSAMFSGIGQEPGEPMEFGDDQGAAGPDSRQGFVQSCPFLFLPVTAWSTLIRSWGRPDP